MDYASVLENSRLVIPRENWNKTVKLDGRRTNIAACYYFLSVQLLNTIGKLVSGSAVPTNEALKVTDILYDILFLWSLLNDNTYQVDDILFIAEFWSV